MVSEWKKRTVQGVAMPRSPYWNLYVLLVHLLVATTGVCVCTAFMLTSLLNIEFLLMAMKSYLRYVPNGILARVHERKLGVHKLQTRTEEGGGVPSTTTNITSSLASIGPHTEVLLPTKGSCISFCECGQDKAGIIIAVGSSCGVLLYYLPLQQQQLEGNDECTQSCRVVMEAVNGSLFSPHTTVAVTCGGELCLLNSFSICYYPPPFCTTSAMHYE